MAAKVDISPECPEIITQSNTIRYQLNLTGVLGMAGRTKESVYLFITKHKITIACQSKVNEYQGLVKYLTWPITINSNLYTLLGIVNST